MRRRRLLAGALCASTLTRAMGQQASPSAEDWMSWAETRRAAGDADLAVWLAKQAAAAWGAGDVAGIAAQRRLAGWLVEDGRWPEARRLQARAKADAVAAFDDEAAVPAALPPVPFEPHERAWTSAWAPGPVDAATLSERWQALKALPRRRAVPHAEIAQARDGELRVEAVANEQGVVLTVDDGRRVRSRFAAWPAALREREIGHLLQALSRPAADPPMDRLQALYARLWAPVDGWARETRARTVSLQVDGALRDLPWAALHDGEAWLGERFALRLSIADLPEAPPAAGPFRLRALGVSRPPDPSAAEPSLPGVAAEVCAMVDGPVHGLGPGGCGGAAASMPEAAGRDGAVPGEAWLDAAFTARALTDAVQGGFPDGAAPVRALLHLGTHFDLRPGRMSRSTLLLGDGRRWPLARVTALDFSRHALVSLAACETGSAGGDATESLQTLVMRRGAGAVLAGLWRVDDASTALLMTTFYRALADGRPADALQRAQAAVRARRAWRHPFHWAGFALATRT